MQQAERTLAEELTTDNPSVRMFINFVLGRIRKCDNIGDLWRFKTSITDDGVLYQNFVARAMLKKSNGRSPENCEFSITMHIKWGMTYPTRATRSTNSCGLNI